MVLVAADSVNVPHWVPSAAAHRYVLAPAGAANAAPIPGASPSIDMAAADRQVIRLRMVPPIGTTTVLRARVRGTTPQQAAAFRTHVTTVRADACSRVVPVGKMRRIGPGQRGGLGTLGTLGGLGRGSGRGRKTGNAGEFSEALPKRGDFGTSAAVAA